MTIPSRVRRSAGLHAVRTKKTEIKWSDKRIELASYDDSNKWIIMGSNINKISTINIKMTHSKWTEMSQEWRTKLRAKCSNKNNDTALGEKGLFPICTRNSNLYTVVLYSSWVISMKREPWNSLIIRNAFVSFPCNENWKTMSPPWATKCLNNLLMWSCDARVVLPCSSRRTLLSLSVLGLSENFNTWTFFASLKGTRHGPRLACQLALWIKAGICP